MIFRFRPGEHPPTILTLGDVIHIQSDITSQCFAYHYLGSSLIGNYQKWPAREDMRWFIFNVAVLATCSWHLRAECHQ